MKISFVISDLSSNVLVRAYPFIKILSKKNEIEIIGPAFRGNIYKPYEKFFKYKSENFDEKYFKTHIKRRITYIYKSVIKIQSKISGDIIIAFKPKLTSYGASLIRKIYKKTPIILDIDDWDAERYYSSGLKTKIFKLKEIFDPNNIYYDRIMELFVKNANDRIVTSSLLKYKYKGNQIQTAVDCDLFNPNRFSNKILKKNKQNKLILFTGNVIPHKGIEKILKAIMLNQKYNLKLMIIGEKNMYLNGILNTNKKWIKYHKPVSHNDIPKYLFISDIVILPQEKVEYAQAQIPAKLFEAMAMEKPIIASNVSDIKKILKGCGWVIADNNEFNINKAINEILDNPSSTRKKCIKARKLCIENYSYNSVENKLNEIINKYK